ncbi:Major facilitator, sugar transporter-like [Sesbania bispinosa]|nr:Major facilitator, sugar transporter-like [Sesbania bispinosa]
MTAKKELIKIRGTNEVDEEFNDLVAANESSKVVKHPWATLLKTQYRPQLTMAIAIPFFQQLTSMNVITLKLQNKSWGGEDGGGVVGVGRVEAGGGEP